jgi:23S rRNA (uracil1939-C5)-methyltransferase
MDITSAESKATYRQIKDWVKENYGIKTRNEYIARVSTTKNK